MQLKLYFTIPEVGGVLGGVEKHEDRESVEAWITVFKDPKGYGRKEPGYANVLVLIVDTETGDWEAEGYGNVPEGPEHAETR